MAWLAGFGLIGGRASNTISGTVYAPLLWYMAGERPGGQTLHKFAVYCYRRGEGKSTSWAAAEAEAAAP